MNFNQPKNVSSVLLPLMLILWALGMGVIEYPPGHRRPIFGYLYSTIMWILHSIIGLIAFMKPRTAHAENYFVKFLHFAAFYTSNLVSVIVNFVVSFAANEKRRHCVLELEKINEALKEMGIVPLNKRVLLSQIWQFGCVVITLITIAITEFNTNNVNNAGLLAVVLGTVFYDYALVVGTINITIFGTFNEMSTECFKQLNLLLESMRVKQAYDSNDLGNNLVQVSRVFKDNEKLRTLHSVRKIYTRLVRLSRNWKQIHAPIILTNFVFHVWIITLHIFWLYGIWSEKGVSSFTDTDFIRISWSLIFILTKVAIINGSSVSITSEAHRTCGIILQHLYPIASLRAEVRVFSMQLIQSPLRLSVYGIYISDYTMLHKLIASVATYVVMITQTMNIPETDY